MSGIFYTLLKRRFGKTQGRVFLAIFCVLFCNALCAAFAVFGEEYTIESRVFRILYHGSEYLYFLAHTAVAPLFFVYFMYLCDCKDIYPSKKLFLIMLPAGLIEIMVLLNPLHHLLWYFDKYDGFCRGKVEFLLYILAVLYATLAAGLVFQFRWSISRDRKVSITCFVILTMFGMIVQMISHGVQIEVFCEALGMLGLMFTLEDEDRVRDMATGVYNRTCLIADTKRLFKRQRAFLLSVLFLKDATTIQHLLGSEAVDIVPEKVASFLKTIHPANRIYRTAPSVFALVTVKGETYSPEKIKERFEQGFDIAGNDVKLSYYLLEAEAPLQIHTVSDVLLLSDAVIPSSYPETVLRGDSIGFLFRNEEIRRAIKRAISDEGFRVEFVPIYNVSDGSIWSAEARMWIDDKETERIEAEEFLPIALSSGELSPIGERLIRMAFSRFSRKTDDTCSRLNVDLNIALLIKKGIAEWLSLLAHEYGVDPKNVSLEINEAAIREEYPEIRGNIKKLKEAGFTMTLDLYGSGYSNIKTLFSMGFDHIKSDRKLMNVDSKSEKALMVLEENSSMLRQLGFVLLSDGVDTEFKKERCKELGISYIQGEGGVLEW